MPELIERHDALLVSINDRLAGQPGKDIAGLEPEWIEDLVDVALVLNEAERKAVESLG